MKAQITGYTEDIGECKLDMTLSEYRAKTVANYLKQKGIPESLMAVAWKGPKSVATQDSTKGEKDNNGRVMVQFSRK